MKKIKLIVNNDKKKRNKSFFFIKKEMKTILDLYAKMVSKGEWKDYGLTIGPKEISFDIYQKSSDRPILKIQKNINPRNKDETYLLKDRNGFIIERSENLESLAEQEKGDKMENDDKTEENVYPSTHWTIWVLGLISVAALIAFVMHLKI